MGVQLGPVIAAALSGTALPSLVKLVWRRITRNPKTEAEARKLNVEADGYMLDRMQAEIERLDRELKAVRKEQADERAECAKKIAESDEKIAEMQGDIRQLLQQQTSFGNMGDAPLRSQLRTAYKPGPNDKDEDLIGKLSRVRGSNQRKRK